MADEDAGLFDFSDLGGQRVGQALDFSDLGGQRVGEADEQQPRGGFFGKFADLGAISVENHPEWLEGWPLSADASEQPHNVATPASSNQLTKPLDFSDIRGRRVSPPRSQVNQETHRLDVSSSQALYSGQTAQPKPQKSTLEQLADLNDAIADAETRTVVGAGEDLWGAVKGIGSLFKPPDFMLHPIDQRPKTLGQAISQGEQAGAYTTGLTTVGRAIKGYYDATRQNIQRAEQAADRGDTTGVWINSAAAGLPLVGPLIGGLYEDAQTNDLPTMAGKGISRIGQAMSMAPEGSVIPNPVTTVTKGVVGALSRVRDETGVSTGTAETERPPDTNSPETQRGRIAGQKGARGGAAPGELPADLQELLERINRAGDIRENCGLCVDAFAQTLNGNESFAGEGNVSVDYLEEKYQSRFTDATLDEIENELLADGEGAHAIVKGEYEPGPEGRAEGHVFNAVHWNDGKVYFVDPQSGTLANTSLFRRFQYLRSD